MVSRYKLEATLLLFAIVPKPRIHIFIVIVVFSHFVDYIATM